MIEIEFTAEEIEKLHYEHLHNSHPRVRQRCEVVYLKALGYSHQEIGHIARVSQPTVRAYLEMYRTGGLEKLKELHFHKPTSKLDEYTENGVRGPSAGNNQRGCRAYRTTHRNSSLSDSDR